MAIRIMEVGGKILLEGNINSITEQFLKQHIQVMKSEALRRDKLGLEQTV